MHGTEGERQSTTGSGGSKDEVFGAADHDKPYNFGKPPNANYYLPFSTWEFARLLAYKSRVRGELGAEDSTSIIGSLDSSFLPSREIFGANGETGLNLCE